MTEDGQTYTGYSQHQLRMLGLNKTPEEIAEDARYQTKVQKRFNNRKRFQLEYIRATSQKSRRLDRIKVWYEKELAIGTKESQEYVWSLLEAVAFNNGKDHSDLND